MCGEENILICLTTSAHLVAHNFNTICSVYLSIIINKILCLASGICICKATIRWSKLRVKYLIYFGFQTVHTVWLCVILHLNCLNVTCLMHLTQPWSNICHWNIWLCLICSYNIWYCLTLDLVYIFLKLWKQIMKIHRS